MIRAYTPVVEFALRHKRLVLAGVLVAGAVTIPIWSRIGTELMPPLDEGVILYMPSTMPGISIAEATRLLQSTDRILKSFPEVEVGVGQGGPRIHGNGSGAAFDVRNAGGFEAARAVADRVPVRAA